MINLAKPRVLLAAGKLAKKFASFGSREYSGKCTLMNMPHPAWILRAEPAAQGLLFKRCVVTIQDAVDQLPEYRRAAF